MELYVAIKGSKVLICATAWMNHENIGLSERSQEQKTTSCYDSISRQPNPQRQKVVTGGRNGEQLLGAIGFILG